MDYLSEILAYRHINKYVTCIKQIYYYIKYYLSYNSYYKRIIR